MLRELKIVIETSDDDKEWGDLSKRLDDEFGKILDGYGASTLWDFRNYAIWDGDRLLTSAGFGPEEPRVCICEILEVAKRKLSGEPGHLQNCPVGLSEMK